MEITVKVIDPTGVEGRRASLDAVDDIALVEKHVREVRAILPRHPRDQRDLLHRCDLALESGSFARRPKTGFSFT
jgi:hypothetical protein